VRRQRLGHALSSNAQQPRNAALRLCTINGGDVLKVGVGAAAGAIVGQVIGKNTKGTVIGAVVGAAAGTAYAAATKDSDIRLPAGTHILITLAQRLTVAAS